MIRRVLDDPGAWALAALAFAVWCMAQAFVGEPGAPAESLPSPVYVVAPVVTGAAVASPAGGPPPAAERQRRETADGPAALVTRSAGVP